MCIFFYKSHFKISLEKPISYLVEAGFSSGFSQKTPLHSLASVLLLCVLIFYSKGQVQVNMSLIYIELNFYNSIQKQWGTLNNKTLLRLDIYTRLNTFILLNRYIHIHLGLQLYSELCLKMSQLLNISPKS